jgi:threonine aldolase
MREAIANAAVGDDVFGDDPTTIELERRVCELFGTEAAMFVPSGTMGNQVALATITSPGDEIILDRQCHIFNYEVAAPSVVSGVQTNPIDGESGIITADEIRPLIRPENLHCPPTSVIAIENTHNRAGGHVFPLEEMKRIRALADEHGLLVHLDGARLANAVVASGVSFKEYVSCVDTVSMCFSKGLGAPVGSIVGGGAEMIKKARKKRKQFGGGMRQAGIVAAGALYAINHHVDRLSDDHKHARRLAEAVDGVDGLEMVYPPDTNIVIFDVKPEFDTVDGLLARFADNRILAVPFGPTWIRMVTHLDIGSEDIDHVTDFIGALTPAA